MGENGAEVYFNKPTVDITANGVEKRAPYDHVKPIEQAANHTLQGHGKRQYQFVKHPNRVNDDIHHPTSLNMGSPLRGTSYHNKSAVNL